MRLGGTSDRYEEVYGKDHYSTAFISLRSPLYQGGELSARSRASASALQAAEARVQAERLAARDNLQRHAEQIAGLLARMDVLEDRVTSITETRSLYWDQYLSLGTRNALDLLNAEQEIGLSREDLVNARHDLWSARLGFVLAAGQARAVFGIDDGGWPRPGVAP
jgi:adhesin transport system outer membrane protein